MYNLESEEIPHFGAHLELLALRNFGIFNGSLYIQRFAGGVSDQRDSCDVGTIAVCHWAGLGTSSVDF